MSPVFDPNTYEEEIIQRWKDQKLYDTPKNLTLQNKSYVLPQLPYPSGAGLHVGHTEGYTACDIYARYQRLKGKKVLQVIGWDSFGLPAENYAIKTNIHPQISTDNAVKTFREQITRMGLSVDWNREVGSHNPDYYKWTQWFFLLMYNQGLAYRDNQLTNWCDKCKTVLANDQVKEGKCERCETEIIQKEVEVWYFKITDYAESLTNDLNKIDWPTESLKRQKEWIGLSYGNKISFEIVHNNENIGNIEVFTTRVDTIFGVSFICISPEHTFLSTVEAFAENKQEIKNYIEKAKQKTEFQREHITEKTGVQIKDIYAINPFNDEKIPVFVTDYVLMNYGTGAIMGVPAHDERDYDFAKKYNLLIKEVILRECGTVRENEQFTDGVGLIIYNLENNKYGVLDWSQKGFSLGLVSEGRKENESYDENVKRALYEETGLVDIKEIVKLGEGIYSHYYHSLKKINRRAISQAMFVLVGSDKVVDKHLEEHEEGSKLIWVTADEMLDTISKYEDSDHWVEMWKRGVSYCIEMGYDKETDPSKYKTCIFTGYGRLVNSDKYNGLTSKEAIDEMSNYLEKNNIGSRNKMTKLHDWSVSRQRFWGAPIPMLKRELSEEEKLLQNDYNKYPYHVIQIHAWGSTKSEHFHIWLDDELKKLSIKSEIPELPNPYYPIFNEWVTYVGKLLDEDSKNNVLIGRSLSCWSALKVAESKRLRKLILLCPSIPEQIFYQRIEPIINDKKAFNSIKKFMNNDINFEKVKNNSSEIVIFLSKTDPYIPFNETLKYYKEKFPFARFILYRDAGHFDEKHGFTEFPKLLDEVLSSVRLDIKPVMSEDLPVLLPNDVDFMPTGVSPLTYSPTFQKGVEDKYGKGWKREVDTLDTFMCSSWYYYRYLDPKNDQEFASKEALDKWMPVDFYIGGPEHVTGHLLYSRFFTKVLYDSGYIDFDEPFIYHRHQGLILGEDNRKMSKRWGNVINPMEVIKRYGADTLRLYEMFMGPLDETKAWNSRGELGIFRFLTKVWNIGNNSKKLIEEKDEKQNQEINKLIDYSETAIRTLHFNTNISKFMEFINYLTDQKQVNIEVWKKFLIIFSPYAPFITDKLWDVLGQKNSIHLEKWPKVDKVSITEQNIQLPVQINGKTRGLITIKNDMNEIEIINIIKKNESISKYLNNGISKTIYIKHKIINIITK